MRIERSSAQWRRLHEVRAAGTTGRRYTGHAERTLRVLERQGLISLTCVVRPDALHGRHGLWWIATITEKGDRVARGVEA